MDEQPDVDADLLDRLAALLDADGPPPAVVELAKRSFGLRRLDAELAELVADSDAADLAAVRGAGRAEAPRLLTFAAARTSVELEAAHGRLLGQVLPPGPAAVELERPGEPAVAVETDRHGRFRVERAGPGPVRVVCRRPGERAVATEWTLLD